MSWFHKNVLLGDLDITDHPWDKRICPFDTKDIHNDRETKHIHHHASAQKQLPMLEDFQGTAGRDPWWLQEEVGRRGIVTCFREGQLSPWPKEAGDQRCKGAGPVMEPGAHPSQAPQDKKAEPQQETRTQTIECHGQVLMLGEHWRQNERGLTLQDILEQGPTNGPPGTSSTRATSGHSSSSTCSRRCLKRSRSPSRSSDDRSSNGADCRAAKCKRFTQKLPDDRLEAEDRRECEGESDAARASADTPGSRAAEDPASGCRDPPQPPEPPEPPEPDSRLLLVLCRASALRSQLPRLQLLLQQVHARHRSPPSALVGIVMHPRPDEEAEARRCMETLLCSAFAPHSPTVEVHTAVFSPSRPEGTLDVQLATNRAHRVAAHGRVRLVDRGTQTDGEGPEDEGWERQAAEDVPRRETSNAEGGLCPDPTGPSSEQVSDVTVLLLALLLTPLSEDELDFCSQGCSLG